MGIESIGPSGPARLAGAGPVRPAQPAPQPDRGAIEGVPHEAPRDRIDVSVAGRELAAAVPETAEPVDAGPTPEELAAAAEERAANVRRIRSEVIDGTYRPDADAVAQRMVELGEI